MALLTVSFGLFAALTLAFSATMLVRLWPRPISQQPSSLAIHATAVANIAPSGEDASAIKTIADAIAAMLTALGDFGAKLDKLGPTAIAAVFTAFFAILTLLAAWLARGA